MDQGSCLASIGMPMQLERHLIRRWVYAFCQVTQSLVIALSISISSISPSLSNEHCELPDVIGSMFVPPENRAGEYRITLEPPDYRSTGSVQNHLLFSTIWSRLLSSRLAAETDGRCGAVITPYLFPDLHVFLTHTRPASDIATDSALCRRALEDVLLRSRPSVSAIASTALEEATLKLRLVSRPPGGILDAENVLISALAYIYDINTVMRALVTVGPVSFQSVDAQALLSWLENQRSSGRTRLDALSMCPPGTDPQNVPADSAPGRLPYSNIAPPGAITLTIKKGTLTRFLRHLVVVGDGRRVANTTLKSPGTEKYCNRALNFQGLTAPIQIRCWTSFIQDNAWTVFFCDAKECNINGAAETAMTAIARDPDVLALGNRNIQNGQPRGPYLVKIEEARE